MEQKEQQKLLAEGKKSAAMQWVGAGIVALALVGLGYFIVTNRAQAPAASTENDEAMLEAEGEEATHTFQWSFAIVGGNPTTGADKSQVTLTHNGESKVVGTYEGHCSVVGEPTTAWPLVANELTGVICYWAGAGDEVGIFYENGNYVVKHGTLEEGSAEVEGSRGNYETLFTI